MDSDCGCRQQLGNCTLEFEDGTAIHINPLPEVWIRGILMGDRVMEYLGKTMFTYPSHNLSCEIHYNPDSGLVKWIRGKSTPSDMFKGEIVQVRGASIVIEACFVFFGGVVGVMNSTKTQLTRNPLTRGNCRRSFVLTCNFIRSV